MTTTSTTCDLGAIGDLVGGHTATEQLPAPPPAALAKVAHMLQRASAMVQAMRDHAVDEIAAGAQPEGGPQLTSSDALRLFRLARAAARRGQRTLAWHWYKQAVAADDQATSELWHQALSTLTADLLAAGATTCTTAMAGSWRPPVRPVDQLRYVVTHGCHAPPVTATTTTLAAAVT